MNNSPATDSNIQRPYRKHAFRIILTMIVLMLVGAVSLPFLNVQYTPDRESPTLYVMFAGQGSARVIETEITSVIEGAMNTVEGVCDITTMSRRGGGYVGLTFKEGTNLETARFDISTRLRQLRKVLPEGTITAVSGSSQGGGRERVQILSYTINADMPTQEILRYVQNHIITPLSRVEGVEEVGTSGAMPYEWVLTFDPDLLREAGMGPGHLSQALGAYYQNRIVGTENLGDRLMLVRLRSIDLNTEMERIPVGKVGDRMYCIGDFCTVRYSEQEPYSYNRINGLNTITLYVYAQDGINTLTVTNAVKARMDELKADFPENFGIQLMLDASQSLKSEISRIMLRAALSFAILLLFVLLVSRSLRYLAVIGLTILVNLLSAVIFYNLLGIDIELYSMAGITVSLGIIIDTAIVIADHYTYYGNRKVLTSIAGALLTTIAALLLVFFLPQGARENLTGFVWVIVINLTLSLLVAFFFVPALLEKMPLENKGTVRNSMGRKRRLVARTQRFTRTVVWGRKHRWVYIMSIVLLFGLPIQMLPGRVYHKSNSDLPDYDDNRSKGGLVGLYNSTVGNRWYQRNKLWFEFVLGGSLNIFQKYNNARRHVSREEEKPETVLHIQAEMPEGCNVRQLNCIVVEMENWLSQFDQISMFATNLSGTSGSIDIHFKDEFMHSGFPQELKQLMWQKAMRYGGASWYIPAIDANDRPLSNSLSHDSWTYNIKMYGYNYDLLYRYAQDLMDSLKLNMRVMDAGFASDYYSYVPSEYCLEYDEQKIAESGINLYRYYSYLGEQLYDSRVAQVYHDGGAVPVRLVSSQTDYFDLWHIKNDLVDIDSIKTRLDNVGSITKQRTGMDIERHNQEYVINVGYDFIGSNDIQLGMELDIRDKFDRYLPMGFRLDAGNYFFDMQNRRQRTTLILVVILVIFMICATLFESLLEPLSILLLIPVSFIGMFITCPLMGAASDQGVFAAMIMICGITVNAGIYLTSEYRTICLSNGRPGLKNFIRAFNRKIVPIMLTIVSSALGLIPFLSDGQESQFWFSFAVGVMSGMLFSVIAIVWVMPVFFPHRSVM